MLLAALATLVSGAVLGPEMPLIALGGGLVLAATRLPGGRLPEQGTRMLTAAGGFAAISTLLGSPIIGAFLLMEASGLGGQVLTLMLLPGLLAAGVGSLIFTGLDSWTGLGTFSLAIHGLPAATAPQLGEFAWAVAIGLAAAGAGTAVRWLGQRLHRFAGRCELIAAPVAGLAVAGLAIGYARGTGKSESEVLFSGQSGIGPLISHGAAYSAGALLLLLACKSLAYGVSLSSLRGGPIFPAIFIGAAGGMALSHLPGLPLVAGVAMGIGAMTVVMLTLPMTAVLLATLLLFSDGVRVMPLVIVAVVVAYLAGARLTRWAGFRPGPAGGHADSGPAAAPAGSQAGSGDPAGAGRPGPDQAGQAFDGLPDAEHGQHQDQQGAPGQAEPAVQRGEPGQGPVRGQ